jgi:anti-sigma-K factor RskA
MSARTHEDYKENIGAYVLGALPELEAEVLEKHLAGCEACRAEVAALQPVTAAIARSVPQVEPPASLKASLMATVRSEAEARSATPARERPAESRWSRWLAGLQPRIAATAALAVLALGVVVGVVADQMADNGERTVVAKIDRKLMPTGDATLRISGDGEDARVQLSDAPEPGSGHLYEVWIQRGDQIIPGPTVTSGGDGEVTVPGGVNGAQNVMVTLETKRVAKPTGPVIMTFEV